MLGSWYVNIDFVTFISMNTGIALLCNDKTLAVYPYWLSMPIHYKSNCSQNKDLVVFCSVFRNHCHLKFFVPACNHFW